MTDEARHYKAVGREFASHESVNHGEEEYGRGVVHTNTVEGYYSVFKRGMKGVYQYCSERHLHGYLSEFDFRYSNRVRLGIDDVERADIASKRHRRQEINVSNGSCLRGYMARKPSASARPKPKINQRDSTQSERYRSRSESWYG